MQSPKKKAIEFATSAANAYSRLLRGYLRKGLRRPEDLDDLAQEVYLRLLRIQDETQISHLRNPMAYVYGIASNVITDWHRARDRCMESGVPFEAAILELDERAFTEFDDDPAERIARQQHIERLFTQLPPIQAATLLLRARDELSYEEIAKRLNLSVGMVHYHLTRAKTRIRLSVWDR